MHTAPPVIEAPPRRSERLPMSYEEYLDWAGEDGLYEWVNGEVIIHMPPKPPHQRLSIFLSALLEIYIRFFDLGELFAAPIEVKLWPGGPSREPDLVFLANANLHRIESARITGAPDLVIEIVSDDSVRRDHVNKLGEYEHAGVPEYWILDNRPGQQRAVFYQLGDDGEYEQIPLEEGDIYRSAALPGFWLRVPWLWQAGQDLLRALAEVLGPEQMAEALSQRLGQEE